MCYAYPGPRCTPHARKQLLAAEEMWATAETNAERVAAMEVVKQAQLKYDATLGGQKELREQIERDGDPTGELALRLERGIKDRETSLALIKSAEKGDGEEGEHITHIAGMRNHHIASLNKDPNKDPGLYIDSIAPIEDFRAAAAEGKIFVQPHRDPSIPYVSLNYSPITQITRDWNDVTLNSRGLIIDTTTGEIIARPFPKFFNDQEEAGEHNKFPRTGPVVVSDKMDGSLGISYRRPDGTYAIATRGSMNSEQAIHASELYAQKYAGKWAGEEDEDTTYLFEIIHPSNRIVLDYGDMDDLVLLGAVDKKTGRSIPLTEITSWNGPKAEVYPYSSYAEALSHRIPKDKEGVVIHFTDSDKRVKIKGEEYIRLHKLTTDVTKLRVWEKVSAGNKKNFEAWTASMPDEFADSIKKEAKALQSKHDNLLAEVQAEANRIRAEAKKKGINDKKGLALFARQFEHKYAKRVFAIVMNGDRAVEHPKFKKWLWDQVRPHGRELV